MNQAIKHFLKLVLSEPSLSVLSDLGFPVEKYNVQNLKKIIYQPEIVQSFFS